MNVVDISIVVFFVGSFVALCVYAARSAKKDKEIKAIEHKRLVQFELARLEKEEEEKKQAKLEYKKYTEEYLPQLFQRLQENGFSALTDEEKNSVFSLTDNLADDSIKWHPNESKIIELACSDQAVFNMIQLRNQHIHQAEIKEGINSIPRHSGSNNPNYAQKITAMNAAREFGESFND